MRGTFNSNTPTSFELKSLVQLVYCRFLIVILTMKMIATSAATIMVSPS